MVPVDSEIPEEIFVERYCEEDSVAGDRDTDVELVPVHTLRSHDWTELGLDPTQDIPRTRSDYVEGYSESVSDFVAMSDNH